MTKYIAVFVETGERKTTSGKRFSHYFNAPSAAEAVIKVHDWLIEHHGSINGSALLVTLCTTGEYESSQQVKGKE